jgi:hypothetical protein
MPQTQPAAAVLTEGIGLVRSVVRALDQRAGDLHQLSHGQEWAERTSARARSGLKTLLDTLSELGFSWTDLARLVGVSVPAIQKWRRGEGSTGDNRQKVASLVAACDLIAEHYQIEEVASWFEMPVTIGVPVTPIELWVGGRQDLVFEFASGHLDTDQILSAWDPSWRETYRSDYEVFIADDGQSSLRRRQG